MDIKDKDGKVVIRLSRITSDEKLGHWWAIATRPSEYWLKNPVNNTQWAYEHYVAIGRTFCKTSGWYNSCKKAGLL